VNPHFKERLDDFAQRVILPGLELVQQYCDRQGHRAWVASGLPTGDEIFDQLLEERIHSADAQGLIAALRVERKEVLGSASHLEGSRFYLAIEGLIQEDGAIVGLPSVFYDQGNGIGFQYFSDSVATVNDGAMPILQPAHLVNAFINRFEAFRVPPAASAVSQAEPTPVAKIKPVSPAVAESVAQSMPPSIEPSWDEQLKTARRKVLAV
jgi:methyl coenzyme M reductase beta subunit